MHVDVRHGLSCFLPEIDHKAISISGKLFLYHYFSYCPKKLSEKLIVGPTDLMDAAEVFARQDEQVDWGLGIDVPYHYRMLVLVHRRNRDLFFNKFAEETV
jgi:hypothetical protein